MEALDDRMWVLDDRMQALYHRMQALDDRMWALEACPAIEPGRTSTIPRAQ